MRKSIVAISCLVLCPGWAVSQILQLRPAPGLEPAPPAAQKTADTIALRVPSGTPLKISLDNEVRVRKVGQPVRGKIVEPVYAFDKLVIPAGSEVTGKIAAIDPVSRKARTLDALNADLSPHRQVHITFDQLLLPGGRTVPLNTLVSPDSGGVLEFVSAPDTTHSGVKQKAHNAASRQIAEARKEIHRQWHTLQAQIHEPGKLHRLERYGVAQLPVHPQYLDAGSAFEAELQQPLDFGAEPLRAEALTAIGTQPPPGSMVHAELLTPLDSAHTHKGDAVQAVVTQPLFSPSGSLVIPEGSRLNGSVLQVRPARRLGRNGQLRIVFHEIVPPDGVAAKVEASLEGVAVAQGEHLKLDSEGGAQVTTPARRYLGMAISVALATSAMSPDGDRLRDRGTGGGDGGTVSGASGFKAVGMILGAFSHSRVVNSTLAAYGAGLSVYSHLLARGHDVVYPKDMSMIIGLGTPREASPAPASPSPQSDGPALR